MHVPSTRARIALAALLALAAPALSAPGPVPAAVPPARSVELKVLSYNIKGLPVLTDLDRLKRIGEILAERRRRGDEPDVVLLQEAFVRKSRRVRNRAGYPYVIEGVRDQQGIFDNDSGLEILSDYPIVTSYGRSYRDCAFPECLVSKSILGATIQIPGVPEPLQILTTHLQAGTRNDAVRLSQIDDIAEFFAQIGFGAAPAIFAGDFNFKPRHPSYFRFLREVPMQEAGPFCLEAPGTCQVVVGLDGRTDLTDVWKTAHDRHFYYQPVGSAVRIEPVRLIRNFTEPVDGGYLSDHWGYEVHYRISW